MGQAKLKKDRVCRNCGAHEYVTAEEIKAHSGECKKKVKKAA